MTAISPHLIPGMARLHDIEAEKICLGLAVKDRQGYRSVISGLDQHCFTQDLHQKAYTALVSMAAQEGKPDVHELSMRVKALGGDLQVSEILLWQYRAQMTDNPQGLFDILHELRRKRQSLDVFHQAIVEAMDIGQESLKTIADVELRLGDIRYSGNQKPLKDGDDYFSIVSDIITIRNGGPASTYTTFLPELDSALSGGFEPGTLTVVAARPRVGKTALTMWWLYNWAKIGLPVGFISLEMTPRQVARRELAMHTGIAYNRIKSAAVSDSEVKALNQAGYDLRSKSFHRVSLGFGADTSKVRSEIMKMHYDLGCKIVVIDYLQRMRLDLGHGMNEVTAIGKACNEIKASAVGCGIAVILLSQLVRATESSDKPRLHHLRGSGMIEEAADTVMLLHRSDLDPTKRDQAGNHEMEIIIEKNRDGDTNLSCCIGADMATNTFSSKMVVTENLPDQDYPPYESLPF